jgi:hypothetical protein
MTKKLTLLLVILVAFGFMLTPNAHAEADGFRGLKWGTKFSTVRDKMNYIRTDPRSSYGTVKIYSRKNEQLRIGGVDVRSIEYGFWKDKLGSVMIGFKGYSNFLSLKDVIFQRVGAGHKTKRFMDGYVWGGLVTGMSLEYKEVLEEGYWFLFSIKIYKEQKRFVAEKAKKGEETDF